MQFTKLTLISFFILLLIGSIFAQQEKPAPADKGYQLIKTYCYVCHNPNVTRHDQMIAPPMMMVKRHYQPNFTNKEDFINAIVNWVHHPSAEKALMPGAVRKFKIMPPLAYPKEDLEAIAAYMFDHELDKPMMMGQMRGNKNKEEIMAEKSALTLNDGKKWKIDHSTMETMKSVNTLISNFTGKEITDYHKLGKAVFAKAKKVIMDENNRGEAFEQLHTFFHGLENNMHQLMEVNSIEEGEKYKGLLEVHARSFESYFEE